jgi:predicted ester cyclase
MTETKQLQRWYDEVWNQANEDAIDELLAENAVIHGLETNKAHFGPAAFKPFYKTMREALPQVSVTLDPIVKTDDIEAAYCFVTATNAEGKNVSFSGISIAKFKDGKLIEGWNGFDFMTMYQQLGFTLTKQA